MTQTQKRNNALIICLSFALFVIMLFTFAPQVQAAVKVDCSKLKGIEYGTYNTDGEYYYDRIYEGGKYYFVVATSKENIDSKTYKYRKECASRFSAQSALSDKKNVLFIAGNSKNSNKYKIKVLNLKTGKVQESPYFTSYGGVEPLGVYKGNLYFNGIVKKKSIDFELDRVNIKTAKTKYIKPIYNEIWWHAAPNGRYYYAPGKANECKYYIYDAKKGKVIRTLKTWEIIVGPERIAYTAANKLHVAGLDGSSPKVIFEIKKGDGGNVRAAKVTSESVYYAYYNYSGGQSVEAYYRYNIKTKEATTLTYEEYNLEVYGE